MCVDRQYIYNKDNILTDLEDTRQCPLVLLVKVGPRQYRALESVTIRCCEIDCFEII